MANKKKLIRNIIIITASTLALIAVLTACAAFVIFANDYYRAEDDAEAAMSAAVTEGKYTVFKGGSDKGFIFYPGGKVDEAAYAPLLTALAERGITSVLVEMPLKLAVLDSGAWRGALEAAPDVKTWYIGGHSLGGAMAASALDPEKISGLVLLGAYSTNEITVPTLSVYGEHDGVMQRDKYEAGLELMTGGIEEVVIKGGNHAGFGLYGKQDGDGEASISAKEQISITADLISEFCKK